MHGKSLRSGSHPEMLDTHSLRRAWVATAKRNGVADAVGMKVSGHTREAIYDGYGRNTVGDNLVDAVQAVRAGRNDVFIDSESPTREGEPGVAP